MKKNLSTFLKFSGVLFLFSIALEIYTYTTLNKEAVREKYKNQVEEIFASTCVYYHDGCNSTGTPYSKELYPNSLNLSTMLYCSRWKRSIPFGLKRVKSKGAPRCLRLEGLSNEETREYLRNNPLPMRAEKK